MMGESLTCWRRYRLPQRPVKAASGLWLKWQEPYAKANARAASRHLSGQGDAGLVGEWRRSHTGLLKIDAPRGCIARRM